MARIVWRARNNSVLWFFAGTLCLACVLFAPAAGAQTSSSGASTSSSESGTSSSTAPESLPPATNQYSPAVPLAPAAANAAVAPSAAASVQRPLTFRVGSTVTWDSNVFLLPDSADPQALLGTSTKSDRIASAYVGLHLDTTWRQQRFYLDATDTAYRHQNFSYLNDNALQYQGAWDWRLGSRLSGSLSASRSRQPVNRSYYQNFSQRNIVTSNHRELSLDAWVSGGWHLLGGLIGDEVRNSSPFEAQGSYRGAGVTGGVRYVAPSGNSIAFVAQGTRNDYLDRPLDAVNLIDDGFRRTESDLVVNWRLTGKSTLSGRAGRLVYRSDHFSQRDFSGAVGQIAWQWQATGKLFLRVYGSRTLAPYTVDTASYVASNTFGIGPSWQMTSNIAMRLDLSRSANDYRGAIVALSGPQRSDTVSSAQLAMTWAPTRSLSLRASLRRLQQTSNIPASEYTDRVAQLNAELTF